MGGATPGTGTGCDQPVVRPVKTVMLYARSRHLIRLSLVIAALGLVHAMSRDVVLILNAGGARLSYRYVLVTLGAGILAGAARSPCSGIDLMSPGAVQRARRLTRLCALLLGLVLFACLPAQSWASLAVYARSFLVWFSLGLIASEVVGDEQAWVGPLVALWPPVRYGYQGGRYAQWNWAEAQWDAVPAALICAGTAICALLLCLRHPLSQSYQCGGLARFRLVLDHRSAWHRGTHNS